MPATVRDPLYRLLARYRYRWFGRRETCLLPAPNMAERFMD